ncbi:family 16 glycosylhydrolase [Cereibacter sphaeroides]|uniref:family 16 glycosylhydrolase n=1 Tax=Cereibacter sphaeroides TaxID=1063 RepID=UPI001F318AB3|nr:family 16 glycosylhydrolase [Cereibacter sphaeroides]MCE6958496.1 family 16 glycosylhydrolase [Cereibacter sphaeroides]MCE6972842.1 family 16 glycosylhydrolase [Cereibacter sphaeroides]
MFIKNGDNDFLVSAWDAGQSYLTTWRENNVVVGADGRIALNLNRAEPGAARPYIGGEIQSEDFFSTGSWSWMAQAPKMVDGAVFGLFLYQADYRTQPWREYDIEFVGGDTTKIHLAAHFLNSAGQHVTVRVPHVINLGFDASAAAHVYSIDVTSTSATFRVDGEVVDVLDAGDIQGSVWDPGPLKSLADLWVTPPELAPWAGNWTDPGRTLTGYVENIRLADDSTIQGDRNANALTGTAANDLIYGFSGNDTLNGAGGSDTMYGGAGNDILFVTGTGDRVVERSGEGTDTVKASIDYALGANVERLILTGTAAINGTGNGLANVMTGNTAANRLNGGAGNDSLSGGGGNDVFIGGSGVDTLTGGAGADRFVGGTGDDILNGGTGNDVFVFQMDYGADAILEFVPRDVITDFVAGGTEDRLEIHGFTKYTLTAMGEDTLVTLTDGFQKYSVLLEDVARTSLTASDFVFV